MYGSPAMQKDLNLPFPSDPSNLQLSQPQLVSPALMRYGSASSTLLGEACEEFLPHRFMGGEEVAQVGVSACGPQMLFQSPQQQLFPSASTAAAAPSLVRQSSSPAGLFSHIGGENDEYYQGRLKGQASFPSRQGSAALMAQISEDGNEDADVNSRVENGTARCYIPGYPLASWEDSTHLSENFAGAKRGRDVSEPEQNGGVRTHQLTHHLSLQSTSEMGFLQLQDAVPCVVRAKRGCATHPRSIAERVRRTKISERIRKLQELVPNMDKQTSTADMLDLAVEYIKELQKSVQTLADGKAKCTCTSNRRS